MACSGPALCHAPAFTYTLGQAGAQDSTLRRKQLANDCHGARIELMKWVYGGGKRLRGLELRRAAECLLLPTP